MKRNEKVITNKTTNLLRLFCGTAMAAAVLNLYPVDLRAQTPVTARYLSADDLKNYSTASVALSSATNYGTVMAGTAFNVNIGSNKNAIHFIRFDTQGVEQNEAYLYENGNYYNEERCISIDADPNDDDKFYITSSVRFNDGTDAQDRIKIYIVHRNGSLIKDFIIARTSGTASNLYPVHTLLDNGNLFICGACTDETATTSYPSSPTYVKAAGSVPNSRIAHEAFVMKVDVASSTPSVLDLHSYNYDYQPGASGATIGGGLMPGFLSPPEINAVDASLSLWPNSITTHLLDGDYDMAMRLTKLSNGDIHVTGSVTGMKISVSGSQGYNDYYSGIMNLVVSSTNVGAGFTVSNQPYGDNRDAYGIGIKAAGGSGGYYILGNHYAPDVVQSGTDLYGMAPVSTDYFVNYMDDISGIPTAKYSVIPFFATGGYGTVYNNVTPPPPLSMSVIKNVSWAIDPLECLNCLPVGANTPLSMWVSGYTHLIATCPTSSTTTDGNAMLDQLDLDYDVLGSGMSATANHQVIYPTATGTGGAAANNYLDLGGGLSNPKFNCKPAVVDLNSTSAGLGDIIMSAPVWNNTNNKLNLKYIQANGVDGSMIDNSSADVCPNSWVDCPTSVLGYREVYGLYGFDHQPFFTDNISYATVLTANTPSPAPNTTADVCSPSHSSYKRSTQIGQLASNEMSLISVYPNPVNDYIVISTESGISAMTEMQVSIIDMLGKEIAKLYSGTAQQLRDNNKLIIPQMANGLYILQVYANGKIVKHEKIAIQQ